jgi:hypothetical protein
MSVKDKIVIFDLDGTLANTDARMRLATANKTREADYDKIDWSVLHDPENIKLDLPNVPVVAMCTLLYDSGASIYIFSGRSDRTKLATKLWLEQHDIKYHKLVMRPSSKKEMYISDQVLKKNMLDDHCADLSQVLGVFDDRQKVVDMWRENGLTCFQVDYGDF